MSTAGLLMAAGGALLLGAGVLRWREHRRDVSLAALLDLPGEPVVDAHCISVPQLGRIIELLSVSGSRHDGDRWRELLRRAAHQPGNVAAVMASAVAAVVVATLITGQLALGFAFVAATAVGAVALARRKRRQWVQKIEEQFPDALATIASSLQVGNPLRRSLQILAERGAQPLARELELVLSEVDLGASLPDAMDSMAERVGIDDVRWFARALRIQQTTGGQLAPLVHTVADVMTARAEMQREARVLTAEGRLSAWLLGALPVVLVIACQLMNPDYLEPMFRGWGLFVLCGCAASIALGISWILRMVYRQVAA